MSRLRKVVRPGPGMLVPLLLGGAAAHAASLPVDSVYGSGTGCHLYSKYGLPAIVKAGGTLNLPPYESEADANFILTRNDVVGNDFICQPSTVDGDNAALNCVSDGATWMPMPIASLQKSADSVVFTMDDEPPVTLEKCGP